MIHKEVTLRIASRNEAELIADISRQTFYDTFAAHNSERDMALFLNEQFTREYLIQEVGSPKNLFLLAYVKDELAGYIKLRDGDAPKELRGLKALEIARLYSVQNMIGKGVGKAMMQEAINIAEQKGKDVVWLAVWEKNQRAHNFYTRWGFETFGKQVFVLGTDLQKDWLMKKTLKQKQR